MFLLFDCPKCGVELEVEDSGVGEQINCPKCNTKIRIPEATAPGVQITAGSGGEAAEAGSETPRWGAPTANPIASSAAAKVERHLKVPVHTKPTEALIAKPPPPLEVAAKMTDRQLRVKTIRHLDCVEVGHDRFDEVVSSFLGKIGEQNLVSVTPVSYSHVDIATQKLINDFGVMILYRG